MYWNDHQPPHFHAIHGGHDAEVSIAPVEIIEGTLPSHVRKRVFEWARMHQRELLENWRRARRHDSLPDIPALPGG